MTIPGGFTSGDVLGAADMNGLPAGKVAYAQVTTAQTGISTTEDLTSLTGTWTAVSSRLYRVSFCLPFDITWNSGTVTAAIYITDASDNIKQTVGLGSYTAAATDRSASGSVTVTSLSGSTTWKLRATTTGANGGNPVLDIDMSSTKPGVFIVEDIGPA